jgi:major type 1 subunit fimbrin (pilin)
MKRSYIALAALASISAMSTAQASDGTVNFNGLLVTRTCNVSVNGGSNVGTVTLPTLSAATLGAAGAIGGRTMFTVGLSGCNTSIVDFLNSIGGSASSSTSYLNASAYFEAGAGVDPVSHNILNAGGSATGVQLQLVTAGGLVIGAGDSTQPLTLGAVITATGAVMNYGVQYFATSAATSGSVVGSVTYSIAYN